jgi:thiol-disulfide isomerase/thioredoxin
MKNPWLRFLGIALLVLAGIWAGLKFHSVQSVQSVHSVQSVQAVHKAPDAGVPVPAGVASAPDPREDSELAAPHPVIPTKLPDFSLKDLSGKPTSVASWSGKSLVINFWATWCAPCRREMPLLKTLAADWAGRDLAILGIAVDDPDKVRAFASRSSIGYPVLIGEQDALDVAAKFGMTSPALPFTVFVDRRGEVVALFLGELHRPQADFILSQVQNLNDERIALPQARRAIAAGLEALAEKHSG